MTTAGTFDADEAALGISGCGVLDDDAQGRSFIGRIDFTVPPAAHGAGTYYVVVIDSRSNTIAPSLFTSDGGGWDGFLENVPKQIPWLSAMAPRQIGENTYTSDATSVWTDSDATRPIAFTGALADAHATVADLTVALIFVGDHQQIYWATKLPVTR